MKLLTFLGVAAYKETIYVWQNRGFSTRFAPAATCHFLMPDTLTVFLTEEAEEKIFPQLRASLPQRLTVNPIPVSLGQDEKELWHIFDQVSGSVEDNETVAFDITHGLRSFPLIGLLVAAYLRTAKQVSLKAVLYGAYDVGQQVSPGRTPIFDLTPMITLLEWATAADRFNRTGDSRYLAALVKALRKEQALAAQSDPEQLEQIGRLNNLAGALTAISQSLRLIRPRLAMTQAHGLEERVSMAKPGLERALAARPFSLVLDSVVKSYQPLALPDPDQPEQARETLLVERKIINWYAEREQWVQAITLAREWLVSWIMLQLGMNNLLETGARQRLEGVIGSEAASYLEAEKNKRTFTPLCLAKIPDCGKVIAFWLSLSDLRNDIDHAGMRPDPGKPEDLIKKIKIAIDFLNNLQI